MEACLVSPHSHRLCPSGTVIWHCRCDHNNKNADRALTSCRLRPFLRGVTHRGVQCVVYFLGSSQNMEVVAASFPKRVEHSADDSIFGNAAARCSTLSHILHSHSVRVRLWLLRRRFLRERKMQENRFASGIIETTSVTAALFQSMIPTTNTNLVE